jgi:uncharacterized protein (DUF433 family)
VQDVLSYLASGMTEQEILEEFPDLEKEDFQAVYKFAAEAAGNRFTNRIRRDLPGQKTVH